ncbi:MAG: 7-cyano-7-deazaguanine synthase, partial [Bdellovibrionota bacterium]
MKCVVLLSGGLDSAANLALSRSRGLEPVLALTVDYGQKAAKEEGKAARKFSEIYGVKHATVDIPFLGELGRRALTNRSMSVPALVPEELASREATEKSATAVWVPNRNGLLIAIAASFAESLRAERVLIGFNREEAETFSDNSEEFGRLTTQALALSTR